MRPVIDASAGAEIVADTRRGRALARLVPAGAEGWVPEHFFAEVLGVLRRQFLVKKIMTESQANVAVVRLGRWRLRRASHAPLVDSAWAYRHKMTAADALYVVLLSTWPPTTESPWVWWRLRSRKETELCLHRGSMTRRPVIER